jgi:A/G-specific adenine glycosylase
VDLALASEDEVLKLWQGLGYYSRARNLHFTAQFIHNKLGGIFPDTFESLIELKGVGDYTASAIASICFGIPQAVVDGNVYRFLSRYFGIETPINSTIAHKIFKKKAMSMIGESHPGTFNQAMMEFGSLHCTPKKPKCSTCPFSKNCVALNQNKISSLPVKTSRIKIKKRYFNYLVISNYQDYYVFEKTLVAHPNFPKKFNTINKTIKLLNSSPVIHKLSHQILEVNFWQIKTKMKINNSVPKESIYQFAVPVVIDDFLKKFF